MPFTEYKEIRFKPETLALIKLINVITEDYANQGLTLTVRQLYYQLVSKAAIENSVQSYRKITSTVNDGRLAGYIDWNAIEDRTREFTKRQRWGSPEEILENAAHGFHMDMWANQDHRVFVIIEKEALSGVLQGICREFDVPMLAARGYPSISVLYELVTTDLKDAGNQDIVFLHLGDHDPSGIDMTRDLQARLELLGATWYEFERIALTMDQIHDQKPPPNPAKESDSRFEDYAAKYGDESWELDALSPAYLRKLVAKHIARYVDKKAWAERQKEIQGIQGRLLEISKTFSQAGKPKKR